MSYKKWTSAFSVCFLLILTSLNVKAQKSADSSSKLPIQILGNTGTLFQSIKTDSGVINKLINNVSLQQGTTFMNCDSAYINSEKNNMWAFGDVVITQQGGTQVKSDYLRYTGNTKIAYLKGNVSLIDSGNHLWSEDLEYNLNTKTGTYTQGGTLQSETTTLSSNSGVYNVNSKDARFTGEVFVTDPEYNVVSKDLGYNTGTKMVHFFDSSTVTNNKSILKTSNGTWDAKNKIAHFIVRSSIQNAEQYIEADTLNYNRITGFGRAYGYVEAIDTVQHSTLFCGVAFYNEISKELIATIKPVMKRTNGKDSLYIRADTFFAAPVPRASDSIKNKTTKIKTAKAKEDKPSVNGLFAMNDSTQNTEDSSRPRYFIGYHHVLIYSDSLQASCDSISYSQADSTLRLMYNPVAWSRKSQITGDTILLYMDSSKLKKMFVPNNGLIVSQSGPDKAKMFDQVQGKTITGYFENNNIHKMVVWPNAETIYFSKDDNNAYLGMNQAESERMKVLFDSSQISKIIFEQDVKQSMKPMQQVNFTTARLSHFKWLQELRPKSIAQLFTYDPYATVVPKQQVDNAAEVNKQQKVKAKKSKKK